MTTPFPFPRELRQSDVLSGDGTPGPFGPSTFKVFDVADVQVFIKPADADAFTLTEEVTVTKTADEAFDTFSITFDDDLPETTEWLYQSARTQTRETAVTRGGAINSTELERELSKLGTIVAELRRDIDRAWQTDFGGTAGRIAAGADGTVAMFDAAGNLIEGPSGEDIEAAQTSATTATTKAAEAAASAAAAAASAAEADGDVTGPASSVDSQLAVFSGTSGKTLKVGADTEKSTPIDADRLPLIDSAATNAVKWLSLTNLWTWIKAKADTFYQALDAQLSSLIRQNSQSAAYTLVLTDGGKHIFHPTSDGTARIWTIPANASVAYPIGTAITFINQNGAGVITIAITSDTMRLAGAGTTGSRTLAANGIATAVKVTSTEWIISGTGLT